MGLAPPAELNGYPGPSHVVELADRIGLAPGQIAEARRQIEALKAETFPLGHKLIRQEAELDRLFSTKTVTPASLSEITRHRGDPGRTARGAPEVHLSMLAVISPEQVARYGELRGYGSTGPEHRHRH